MTECRAEGGVGEAPCRVLIAGCGDLGTEIGLRLAAAGHVVHGLRRDPSVLPGAIRPLAGDLGVAGGLPPLPPSLDLVVYAAAAGGQGVDGYRRTYRDGLARVLETLDRDGQAPARVLFVSATSVYGVDDGSWVDETTPAEPRTATGAVLLEAEQVLAAARFRSIAFRLAGLYGPGRTRLLRQVRDGRAVQPSPPVHTNRIHRDDAARATVHLLTAVADPEPVYLGVDHDPADKGEVVRFLAAELGVLAPPEGPGGRGRGGDKRCRNDRLVATGFRFVHPSYREGYRAILAGDGVRHP